MRRHCCASCIDTGNEQRIVVDPNMKPLKLCPCLPTFTLKEEGDDDTMMSLTVNDEANNENDYENGNGGQSDQTGIVNMRRTTNEERFKIGFNDVIIQVY